MKSGYSNINRGDGNAGFFEMIIGYIEMVWDFFLNLINSLVMLISAIAGAVILPPAVAVMVPSFLAISVVAMAGISICKLVIGRIKDNARNY